MALGTALVLISLSLLIWNIYEDNRAGQSSELLMPEIVEHASSDENNNSDLYIDDMKAVQINGDDYVGYLTVPSLNLELPVIAQWDYAKLKRSPCRYSGSVKAGNLVIAAHNYKKHFGRFSNLKEGDKIYFTDMDSNRYCYLVQTVEVLPPTAIEEMTSGEYELTLFTCNYSGKSRITVRCSIVKE